MINIRQPIRNYLYRNITSFFPTHNIYQNTKGVGITTLVHHNGVDMLIYSLSSFFYFTNQTFPVFAVEDGTITNQDRTRLNKLFNIRVISRKNADKGIARIFKGSTNFLKYRFDNNNWHTKRKFDAIFLSPFERSIYIEPDLLFSAELSEIKSWLNLNSNTFLHLSHARKYLKSDEREDIDYSLRLLIDKHYFRIATPSFNTGLLCIPNIKKLKISKLDNVFKLFNGISYSRAFCAEETAFSVLFKDIRSRPLPSKLYTCVTTPKEYRIVASKKIKMMHYISETKTYLEKDSVKLALKTNFFRK